MRFLLCALSAVSLLGLTACGTLTQDTTITTYDAEGRIATVTKTSGSVIPAIVESTKNKTVIAWDNSWVAGVSVSTATVDDPTPTFRAMAGRKDKGVINLLPQHKIDVVRDIIPAIRAGDLSVSTSGLNAGNSDK